MSTESAPQLHPVLQGTPSLTTQKAHAIHRLASEINMMVQLLDLLKFSPGLREPDKYGDVYALNKHLELIRDGRYQEALALVRSRGL